MNRSNPTSTRRKQNKSPEDMNGHFYFEIQANDTHRAAGLYKGVFGWKFEEVHGLPAEYWRIETGGA